MTGWLTERAAAKINLTLHITGRAPNGYHLLDSLVVFGPAADVLHVRDADTLSLEVAGRFAGGLAAEADNLVLRAARALADWGHVPPRGMIRLDKHLPVASGIGGGSADAAATLRLLARLWRLQPPPTELTEIAARLGADVPVCLASRPARMAGIGEILSPAPTLPAGGLLLVNPGIAVATAEVFRARNGAFSAPATFPAAWPDLAAMAGDLAAMRNDLEHAALSLCPPVGDVLMRLRRLPGCRLARMSGSGATCFALLDDAAAAAAGAAALPAEWWTSAGTLAA